MSVGFKRSLFGFNCQDVVQYIEKTHKSFAEKEATLKENIEDLNLSLEAAKEEREKVEAQKQALDKKLNEFNEKYIELERLSENINKLYSIAQQKAKAIVENGENSFKDSCQEVNKNLYSLDEAHTSLTQLRNSIAKTSADFTGEVDKLISSLQLTRDKISKSCENAQMAKDDFEEAYISLVK